MLRSQITWILRECGTEHAKVPLCRTRLRAVLRCKTGRLHQMSMTSYKRAKQDLHLVIDVMRARSSRRNTFRRHLIQRSRPWSLVHFPALAPSWLAMMCLLTWSSGGRASSQWMDRYSTLQQVILFLWIRCCHVTTYGASRSAFHTDVLPVLERSKTEHGSRFPCLTLFFATIHLLLWQVTRHLSPFLQKPVGPWLKTFPKKVKI